MLDLEHASDLIMAASDLDRMQAVIRELKDVLELDHLVYHRIRAARSIETTPLLILTYDPHWVSRYVERDYFRIDPAVTLGSAAVGPVDWADLDRGSFAVRRMFTEADRYGVGRQGVSIPIRGPGGERALFTGTSNADYRSWTATRLDRIRALTMTGQYIHDRVAHITGSRAATGPRLTARELEYMTMLVRGKTIKQIAGQVVVSESAVRMTLASSKYKLMSSTLHQAVARAVSLGLVAP